MNRFCRFQGRAGTSRWGVIKGSVVSEILPDPFGPWEETGLSWPLGEVRLTAPCEPSKVVCVGVNYVDHAREFGKVPPKEPLIFLKPPSAVVGPGEAVRLPGPRANKWITRESWRWSSAAARGTSRRPGPWPTCWA